MPVKPAAPSAKTRQEQTPVTAPVVAPPFPGYPAPLLAEYHALVDKKMRRTITELEAARLQEIREKIDEIDRQRPRPDIWDIQHQKLRDELAQLRAEIEALPDLDEDEEA